MNVTKKAARVGLALALMASLVATIAAPAALASTSVTSAGAVPVGGTSAGTASFTFTENTATSFPPSGGTLIVTIRDSVSAATVHFTGSPVVTAPGSVGATVAIGAGGSFFTLTLAGSDVANPEQITVSNLNISADAGAAAGAIQATLGGTLAGAVTGGTVIATGILQVPVAVASTAALVNVSSACPFAVTGGPNTTANFSDTSDARSLTAVTAPVAGQQTLTFAAGAFIHGIGVTVTQTVSDCFGATLGSPGTVGGVGGSNHLAFTTQPGGGAPGVTWGQQPVVAIQNSINAVITTDNTTIVTISIGTNPAGGTLTCTSGTSRVVVAGVATFFGCSINNGSASPYTLIATSSPFFTPATSSGFLIGTTANHLAFIIQPGGGLPGVAWSQQPSVAVQNSVNAVVTTDNTTIVTISIGTNPAAGTLTCTSGTSRVVVAGVASFFGCSINNASTSPYTLIASSSPFFTPATSAAFIIGTTTNHLAFVIQPGGGLPGAVWSQQPVVAVQNSVNAIVTTDNSTIVTLTIGTNPAGGTLACTSGTSRVVVGGIATFFGCSINNGSASPYTLVASSTPIWLPAISSAFLIAGALPAAPLADAIARGVNRGNTGFGTASVVVPRNSYITILGVTSPSLFGASIQIWTRTKTGPWALLTSRNVASDGTIHYFARVNGWTAYQLKFAGNASFGPNASHGRIATNPS